jgi:aldose 1-epimerase
MERLSLRSDLLHAEVAPAIGGAVTRLDLHRGDSRLPILRPSDDAALAREGASQAAMHPLLPFANRVPGNVIDLVEPPLTLQPNVAGESCALHGIGWQRAWCVLEAHEDRCALELIVPPEEWVFGFRAVQEFSVQGGQFRAELAIENTTGRPIPVGLGFHPYFVRVPGMTLTFHAERFWLEGPGHLPTDAISLPPELDFSTPAPLPGRWRNNCYSGWDGCATLYDAARGLELNMRASHPLRDLMLYIPPGDRYFCLEPQTHTTGAVTKARARQGTTPLRILAPMERLAVEMTIVAQTASTERPV